MTEADRKFLVGFEMWETEWEGYGFEYFKGYPSVKWKLLNLQRLARQNPEKLAAEAGKLKGVFSL